MKFLIINGPNINMLGIREPEIYGGDTYDDLIARVRAVCEEEGIEPEFFQSNHEGEIVDCIQRAYLSGRDGGTATDGIIINPAAYTHTSIAILDALKAVNIPAAEVHISRVSERDAFRQTSYVRAACAFVIEGRGIDGYCDAVRELKRVIASPRADLTPSIDALREAASSGRWRSAVVALELPRWIRPPLDALRALRGAPARACLLESAADFENRGRYCFLGYDPRMAISCADGAVTVDGEPRPGLSPEGAIRSALADFREIMPFDESCGIKRPQFVGGLAGYFSYDFIKYAEPTLRLRPAGPDDFPDADLMFFDKTITFDNALGKMTFFAVIKLADLDAEYERARREIAEAVARLESAPHPEAEPGRALEPMRPAMSEADFCRMVERAKELIREGDIFQIVLSNKMEARYEGSLLGVYEALRDLNPSPYMFYVASPSGAEVAGASPETLVSLRGTRLETFPLAGTRPRGATPAEDAALERELLADEKELAEHNMLVDLGRNDLGRVSRFGSVVVERFHDVRRFSHVMHIGSTVRGELRPGLDALDAISAVLPAGTLSGAPKLRACQRIDELERDRRGVYGGAIGYIDISGDADTCIAIRCACKKNGRVSARSGAGIVADSNPASEHRECVNKAAAVARAIESAERRGAER